LTNYVLRILNLNFNPIHRRYIEGIQCSIERNWKLFRDM